MCVIIGIIASFALPSYMQARKVAYEDNAMGRLRRLALAESRYYGEFQRFANFNELVDVNYIPRGYSTLYQFTDPVSSSSVLPFIDRYSLAFFVPDSPNSLYYKIDAVPVGDNRMGLRTFNINLFVTGTTEPDNLLQEPPIREGLGINAPPVVMY